MFPYLFPYFFIALFFLSFGGMIVAGICTVLDAVLLCYLGREAEQAFWIGVRQSLRFNLIGRIFRWIGERVGRGFSLLFRSIGWMVKSTCQFLFSGMVDHFIEVGKRSQKAEVRSRVQPGYSNLHNSTASLYVSVPRTTTIRVRDFSATPGGLTDNDGPHNAERFRKTVLVPALRAFDHVEVQLEGVHGYAHNWLEHSFGRFPEEGIDRLTAANKLEITYAEKAYSIYKTIAERAVREGVEL